MNNYNKIQKAKIDIEAYIENLDNFQGSIHPKEIKVFLDGIIKTLEA